MNKTLPFCSIIILNYFGEKVIPITLDSLLKLNYPKNLYEIIVVDNNSKDKSRLILQKYAKKDKRIKLIFSKKNLGFAGGNNLGIKKAQGKYVVLLNNDCWVDKDWLINLVKTADKDEKIFAVNSKILLYPKFFSLKIKNRKNTVIEDFYLKQSNLLEFIKEKKLNFDLKIEKNFYQLEIPYDPIYDKNIVLLISFKKLTHIKEKFNPKIKLIGINSHSYEVINQKITSNKISFQIKIKILPDLGYDKIQNAGIFVFQDGSGRDIGSVVRYQNQNYEIDFSQYNQKREVYATCGAASLYRKEILEKIGYLDSSFFMYYEDVEICERARLMGYKCVYSPNAIVRHLHALSSKEWSPFFIYNAEKGRLLHVLFHFPLRVFFYEYLKFLFKNIIKFIFRTKNIKDLKINFQYIKIIFYFIFNFPILILKRKNKHKNLKKKNIYSNYQKILKGYWYFN